MAEIEPPEGKAAGMPYDWRKPTAARLRSRAWNPDDPRLFTPKTFGWGYDINTYWLIQPARYLRGRNKA
jgi:hypothetical protein